MFASQSCQAGLSGRFDTFVTLDNREFKPRSRIEEQLDLNYEHPSSGLRGGLSLGLSQDEDADDAQFYQLYVEKEFNARGDTLQLGRFENADALGFYTLDGARLRLVSDATSLVLYSGTPRRIEDLQALDGDALHGVDLYIYKQEQQGLVLDGRIGWQVLKQDTKTADRLNLGLRGKWREVLDDSRNQDGTSLNPFTFSLTGTYLADEKYWESFQVNVQSDLDNNARVRFDCETYEPGTEVLTFRDRFYSLYGRERQTQLKAGYQFIEHHKHSWSLNGRYVIKEAGDNGYGGTFGWQHYNYRGLRIEAQLDHIALSEDRATSLYVETKKALTTKMRGMLGAVLQDQQKQLTDGNRAVGLEAQLERVVRTSTLPSDLLFSTQLSHIWNSHLADEYSISVRLSYSFSGLASGVSQ
jgi:hypothetical protein